MPGVQGERRTHGPFEQNARKEKRDPDLSTEIPHSCSGGADGSRTHGLRRDRTMNSDLPHRISASYVASQFYSKR